MNARHSVAILGAGKIGRGIARLLEKSGHYDVVVADASAEALAQLAAETPVATRPLDVRDPAAVASLLAFSACAQGSLESLVSEAKADWMFANWQAETENGDKVTLNVSWDLEKHLAVLHVKIGDMESKDALKRRIDEAAKYAPLEQLALSPQCGFSSTVHGNNIAVQAQRDKLRLVIETAQDVWGEA